MKWLCAARRCEKTSEGTLTTERNAEGTEHPEHRKRTPPLLV